MLCAEPGVMFVLPLPHIGCDTNVVAVVRTFEDVTRPALRLAHQSFARSGQSACGGLGGIRERLAFTLSETLVESKRTHNQKPFLLPRPALETSLKAARLGITGASSRPNQADRSARACMLCAESGVMFVLPLPHVG